MEILKCEKCSKEIPENVASFSRDKFKKLLCRDCQKSFNLDISKDKSEDRTQILIIKQAVIKAACSFAAGKEHITKVEQVIEIAQELQKWVLK